MTIELTRPYKSIGTLKTEELLDFAVLIGRNGSGKTQILAALKEGQATIPGISVGDIELYDMASFRAPNATSGSRNSNRFAKLTADRYLLAPPGDQPPIETAAAIFKEFATEIEHASGVEKREEFERNLREEIQHLKDFAGVLPRFHGRFS